MAIGTNPKHRTIRLRGARRPAAERIKPGMERLTVFQRTLQTFCSEPGSDMYFEETELMLRRLTLSYLPLIAGVHYEGEKSELEQQVASPEVVQNVILITSRQSGKTTMTGMFIGALALHCAVKGDICIYSTTKERAGELLKAAKGHVLNTPGVEVLANNTEILTVRTSAGVVVSIKARPGKTDSCRGDAPIAAFFDEIAFCTRLFWDNFAWPLMQVVRRIFTCITTPPEFGTFFSVFVDMVRERNRAGVYFFRLCNHALCCEDCLAKGEEVTCVHRYMLIPPWKSLLRFTRMYELTPVSAQAAFRTEVFGVLNRQAQGYIAADLVARFRALPWLAQMTAAPRSLVFVAVDPPSHQSSSFGVFAFTPSDDGKLVILGLAEHPAERCDVYKLQSLVGDFLTQVRAHPFCGPDRPFVPIVECNNNNIIAASIVRVFQDHHQPVYMPFTGEHFAVHITENIGVWTTHEIKLAGLQAVNDALIQGRLCVAEGVVTVGRSAYDPSQKESCPVTAVDLLCKEWTAYRDMPDGSISGKTSAGLNDDLGDASWIGIHWAFVLAAILAGHDGIHTRC